MELEVFSNIMDANVTQSWLCARAAIKQMKTQGTGGKIVLMSSARGLLGLPAGYTAYCASKSALKTGIPSLEKRTPTKVLPEPIPPVRPILICFSLCNG